MAEKKTTAKKTPAKKTPAKKPETKKPAAPIKARVIYGRLNIRTAPEVAAGNIAGVLKNAAHVEVLEKKDGWCRIQEGWVMAKYLEEIEED